MKLPFFLWTLSALLISLNGYATDTPFASAGDRRLRYIEYDPDQVVLLNTRVGKATYVQFAQDEQMVKWFGGDSKAWEVGKYGNVMAMKPKARHPVTNMIVMTNKNRVYNFDLKLSRNNFYGVRFMYPHDEKREQDQQNAQQTLDAAMNPHLQEHRNLQYAGAGSEALRPYTLFDNGRYTFIKFRESAEWPAIFHVRGDAETLVNPTVRDNWLILPMVSKFWRLRLGEDVLCIKNTHYRPAFPDNRTHTASQTIQRVTP